MKILKIIKAAFSNKMNIQVIETSGTITKAPTLEDLSIGMTVYVVPWCYDPQNRELDIKYTYSIEPGGTSVMPVTKTKNGYKVDFNHDYFKGKFEY